MTKRAFRMHQTFPNVAENLKTSNNKYITKQGQPTMKHKTYIPSIVCVWTSVVLLARTPICVRPSLLQWQPNLLQQRLHRIPLFSADVPAIISGGRQLSEPVDFITNSVCQPLKCATVLVVVSAIRCIITRCVKAVFPAIPVAPYHKDDLRSLKRPRNDRLCLCIVPA